MATTLRSPERLRYHFEVERALAERLLRATRAERLQGLYGRLYDELFRRIPEHPQHARRGRLDRAELQAQLNLVLSFVGRPLDYLGIGAGDCALTQAVAAHVATATAVDISAETHTLTGTPANFRLVLSDGVTLPLPDASIDLVYSNQLMEHLHPEDAAAQLQEIRRVLRPGGIYVCRTPNRLTGPHDISGLFGDVPAGSHLKEYLHGELALILRAAGFRHPRMLLTQGGRVRLRLPLLAASLVEAVLERLPGRWRRSLRRSALAHRLLGICVAAVR